MPNSNAWLSTLFRLLSGCSLLIAAVGCTTTPPTGLLPSLEPTVTTAASPTTPVGSDPTIPAVPGTLIFAYSTDAEPGSSERDSTIALVDGSGVLLQTPGLFRPFAQRDSTNHHFVPAPGKQTLLLDGGMTRNGCGVDDTDCSSAQHGLFLADLGSGQVTQITFTRGLNYYYGFGAPTWSPDATRFALTLRQDGQERLYRYGVSDDSVQALTDPQGARDRYPAWSPDGTWLAFIRWQHNAEQCPEGIVRSGNCNLASLWLLNLTSSESRLLIDRVVLDAPMDPGDDFGVFDLPYNAPAWSPDSRFIVIPVMQEGDQPDITLVELASGKSTPLATDPAADMQPAFSPDGAWISFRSNRSGNEDVFVVRTDGSGLANLSNHPARDDLAMWSPNSQQVAFLSNRATEFNWFHLYLMPLTPGARVQDLHLEYRAINGKPAWLPLP